MKKLTRLAFAAMLALSLIASTTSAVAQDAKNGRETAWTHFRPLLPPQGQAWDYPPIEPLGVTWE